jgi:putative membrane protein insertion efficiency factor
MKRVVLAVLGWYRQYRALRPDACRFDPTCSAYAFQAIENHGVLKGFYFGTRRVLRCHPLGGRGYDPVPPLTSTARSDV